MKILNKVGIFIGFFLCLVNSFSQEVSDFTIVDIEGETYNLYEQLEQGKPVVLDMFARFCSGCSESMPKVDTIWMDYGSGEYLQIWAIETSGYTDSVIQQYKQEHQVSFPFFTSSTNPFLLDSFPISYTPWYYVICPDKRVRQIDFENIRSYVNACASVSINEVKEERIILKTNNKNLFFQSSNEVDQLKISIYNIAGVLLYSKQLYQSIGLIDLKLPTGVYIAKIDVKNEISFRRKFFVK